MVIKEAKIKFEGFWILESSLSFDRKSYYTNFNRKTKKKKEKGKIDFNYSIYRIGKPNKFRIDCEIKSIGKVGSYLSFTIKTESHFDILGTNDKEQIDNMLLGQAIPMIISNIRSFLLIVSGMYPVNRYLLPSIDLHDFYIRERRRNK